MPPGSHGMSVIDAGRAPYVNFEKDEAMALPARVFWALEELAVRWGCAPADIVGWATEGIIEIVHQHRAGPMQWHRAARWAGGCLRRRHHAIVSP